jgi:photosystem II stability/assembly factor-like uncharacterized protein
MKSLKLLTIALLMLLIPVQGMVAQNWTRVGTGVTDRPLFGVSFADNNTVFAVGGNGTTTGYGVMVKSTDAGATWSAVDIGFPVLRLNTIRFTSPLVGYAAGFSLNIIKTTDGGVTWTDLYPNLPEVVRNYVTSQPTQEFWDIDFIDDDSIYAIGYNGQVLKTTDGGTTWTYKSNFGTGTYRDIDVRSESLAYLALHGNNLQKSTDGGMTWANMTYPTVAVHFFSTNFINDTTGFATGQPVAGQPGYVLKTTDGANWTNTALGAAGQIFNRVVFVNNTTGYIVGNGGKIFTTTNTGGTWSEMTSGTANILRNFDFSNNIRIAVGDGGAIMRLVEITTSNENLQENNLMQIYPNPVKDVLNIRSNVDVKKITVRDITGKVVLSEEVQQNIILAHLSKGIYLLQVQTAEGVVEKKIIKD